MGRVLSPSSSAAAISQVDGGGKAFVKQFKAAKCFGFFPPPVHMHGFPPNTHIPSLYVKTALHWRKWFLEIVMGACDQKIILVAFNRNGCAGYAGTMLSTGSMLEVLVMGSGPLGFYVGGKVAPA